MGFHRQDAKNAKALLPLAVVTGAGVLVLVLAACSAALSEDAGGRAGEPSTRAAGRPPLPAIDTRAEADTETATFALG